MTIKPADLPAKAAPILGPHSNPIANPTPMIAFNLANSAAFVNIRENIKTLEMGQLDSY